MQHMQTRVTLHLDREIVAFFKRRAAQPGARRYQAIINAELRTIVEQARLTRTERVEQLRRARRIINRLLRKTSKLRPRTLPKAKNGNFKHAAR